MCKFDFPLNLINLQIIFMLQWQNANCLEIYYMFNACKYVCDSHYVYPTTRVES